VSPLIYHGCAHARRHSLTIPEALATVAQAPGSLPECVPACRSTTAPACASCLSLRTFEPRYT